VEKNADQNSGRGNFEGYDLKLVCVVDPKLVQGAVKKHNWFDPKLLSFQHNYFDSEFF
jgi:hypothetical protein